MIKSIFILFFVVSANHIANVSSINCTSQNMSKHSNECIFECIQIIYDKTFCMGCQTGDRAKTVDLNVNNTFSSLAQYNNLDYNVTSGSIKAVKQCLNCQNNYTDEFSSEKYVQTKELKHIFKCAYILNLQLDSPKEVCSLNEVNRLYLELGERIDKLHDWCYDVLGINEHYEKVKKMAEKMSEKTVNGRSADDETEETEVTTEAFIDIIIQVNETITEVTTTLPFEATTQDEEFITQPSSISVSTTVPTSTVPASTTENLNTSTKTTKSKRKKPKAEEHHYPVSVVVIFAAIGVLLVVLVISSIILSVYVNRRRRIQSRSDSCTYVFDSREK